MSKINIDNDVTMRQGMFKSLGLIDQYELIRELGGGGFGTVYLAKDTVSGIEVAVKGLPPLVKNNLEELENIRRNFALVSRLHHPNIAAALTLHPVVKATYNNRSDAEKMRVFDNDILAVMQYAPGVTLSQWRKQFPGGKVPLKSALDIICQIADALDYAHREKILHRDIKPANVMIETDAVGNVTAQVLDFGLAAEIRSSMGRVSCEIRDTSGTRPFMAPEQWLGKEQGSATDQYALAVMFHELVVGRVPFASVFDTGDPVVMMNVIAREIPEFTTELPKAVRLALGKALAKNPKDRFVSCGEFVRALQGRIKVKPTSGGVASGKGFRFNLIVVAAVIALLFVGGIWYRQDTMAKEQARITAEMKAREEAARLEAERKVREETERIAAEFKAKEEAARLEAERKAREEAARLEAERKVREEAERIAAERKAREEAARLEAERKAKEEAARLEAERKVREEAERIAAERKAKEEAIRLEAERKVKEESERKAEQLRKKAEKNVVPALWCSIMIGNRVVMSGKVLIANKEVGLPFGWSKLEKGEEIPSFDIEYIENGRRYIGRFEKLTVDWHGEKELTISLLTEGDSVAR